MTKINYGAEAGDVAERLGLPVVVCGPGNMDQRHKPGEYIERTELEACDTMLDAVLERFAWGHRCMPARSVSTAE